ncbi:hypothetical protein H6G96_33460 [Nostoc sp. FACHB-892]|uniref:hypothetical protein n=1 Tax=Nostoc sp. FACHB-892 TaxID=2692843 RepID=UPI00168A17FA|nr:hypothetical protein [Nostoc sp. FACHB-892]MBD2731093.1 hypothetical protein [Nostoc sp. FACHB-892]
MQTPRRGERNFCVLSGAKNGRSPPAGRGSVVSTYTNNMVHRGEILRQQHPLPLLARPLGTIIVQLSTNIEQLGTIWSAEISI